jgi:hypothetical protein
MVQVVAGRRIDSLVELLLRKYGEVFYFGLVLILVDVFLRKGAGWKVCALMMIAFFVWKAIWELAQLPEENVSYRIHREPPVCPAGYNDDVAATVR